MKKAVRGDQSMLCDTIDTFTNDRDVVAVDRLVKVVSNQDAFAAQGVVWS